VQEAILLENDPKDWDIPPKVGGDDVKISVQSTTGSTSLGDSEEDSVCVGNRNKRQRLINGDELVDSYVNSQYGETLLNDNLSRESPNSKYSHAKEENNDDDSSVFVSDIPYKNIRLDARVAGKRVKLVTNETENDINRQRVIDGNTSFDVVVDVEKETEIDSTMKYLMKSLLHHQRLSGEYQGYINTFVQLRDYHKIRSDQLKHQLNRILKLD
jgi:hypothetical protein